MSSCIMDEHKTRGGPFEISYAGKDSPNERTIMYLATDLSS
jgi:hypothetical protein